MNDKSKFEMSAESILQLLVKRGLIGDEKIGNEQLQQAKQKKQQIMYHNTELLLKQYNVSLIPFRKNWSSHLKIWMR